VQLASAASNSSCGRNPSPAPFGGVVSAGREYPSLETNVRVDDVLLLAAIMLFGFPSGLPDRVQRLLPASQTSCMMTGDKRKWR